MEIGKRKLRNLVIINFDYFFCFGDLHAPSSSSIVPFKQKYNTFYTTGINVKLKLNILCPSFVFNYNLQFAT